ncbi:hypothetical protein [Adlercreutzia sp. ZJ141]|uniref:hypothetical protein n=1 Tax=Adlercreutzia sp. ZJ141 TaxID=2709406 RepID=UPI0013EB8353|nr:hypothetical protein [Adlercreutzia sp. ZJ141]
MEKNRSLRTASGLFVLVLLTICVVGATYAKYVTSDDATDTARVAKWGVTFAADTDLFSQSYKDAAVTDDTATVKVGTTDVKNLVAPGTTGTGFGVMESNTAKPEVSYGVTIELKGDAKMPMLKYRPNDGSETNYEPVKFTVSNGTTVLKQDMDLQALKEFFDGTKSLYVYDIGADRYYVDENLDGTIDDAEKAGDKAQTTAPSINVKWEWKYEGTDPNKALYDELDTILGNDSSGSSVTEYSGGFISGIKTDVQLNWTFTATQID